MVWTSPPFSEGFGQAVRSIACEGAKLKDFLGSRDTAEHLKEVALQVPREHTSTQEAYMGLSPEPLAVGGSQGSYGLRMYSSSRSLSMLIR